jgi:hypothetical protein
VILEVPKNIPSDLSEDGMSAYLTQWIIQKTPLKQSYMHIANERLTSYSHGKKLKAMGVLKHTADHFFTKPNKTHSGMWIELKVKGKKPNQGQLDFLELRRQENYHAFWSDDLSHVISEIALFYNEC